MEEQVVIHPYKRTIGDMTRESIIRFQIMLHCYLNDIHITPAKLQCLTLLGLEGECDLPRFCEMMREKGVFTSMESARNTLAGIEQLKLVIKEGGWRKIIKLHPDMQIQTIGTIWVDIDILHREQVINEQIN